MTASKIRISREEREKQFIKEELMRYHMYSDKVKELKQEIEDFKIEYQYIMNNPPVGGSVIKMPDGTVVDKNLVLRLEGKLGVMVNNLKYYKDRVDTLNKWMGMLTEKQKDVALVYFCEYQCKNVHEVALELGYAEDTIKEYQSTITGRIHKKFKKIF